MSIHPAPAAEPTRRYPARHSTPLRVAPRASGNGAAKHEHGAGERLARGLGWFSIGLGLAEVAAPEAVARAIGIERRRSGGAEDYLPAALRPQHDSIAPVLRLLGMREIASGLGIFSQNRPAGWLWARVAGDIVDLAYLGSLAHRADARRLMAAAVAVAGVTALDVLCGRQLSRNQPQGARLTESDGSIRITASMSINRPPAECYAFWRDFANLPRIMQHLESVTVLDDRRSHWRAKAPAGSTVEWDAELIEDHPNELIAWRSVEGAQVFNEGSVRFQAAPKGHGTVVRIALRYLPPAGALGAAVARLLGEEPEVQVRDDLRRFKRYVETGDDICTDGQPHGPARLSLTRTLGKA